MPRQPRPRTPEEIAKRYTKPDGTIEIPGNQRIIMPPRPSASRSIANAIKELGDNFDTTPIDSKSNADADQE